MMWDFRSGEDQPQAQAGQNDEQRHHHHHRRHRHHSHRHEQPQISMPNPAMPAPQQVSTYRSYSHQIGPSYSEYISPPLTSTPLFNFPMISHTGNSPPQPATQQIHVLNYSHQRTSHNHRTHRKHSTQAVVMPAQLNHSSSYGPPVTVPQAQAQYPSFPIPVQPSHSYSSQPPPQPVVAPKPPSGELNANFQYSKCTGRKKALCIGINYHGQSNELRGCINDAENVRNFLVKYQGYDARDIVLLTDKSKKPATKKNILDAMRWLVRSARTNDSLFFHYSGHGGQVKDQDGDEVDGFDEVIFPLDFKTNGYILDDTMHDIMVKPLPTGCRLTALFDSCHSGTVLDLPYIYSSHGRLKGRQISSRARKAKATTADVISWSGCKDGQTSADTFVDKEAVGAMSHAFIKALKQRQNQSYQELLRAIRLILGTNFTQKPQLGSSHPIDTTLQFVI